MMIGITSKSLRDCGKRFCERNLIFIAIKERGQIHNLEELHQAISR